MNGFIYKIENDVNHKIYIGQTKNSIDQRFKEHIRHSKFSSMIIHRAMRKYGVQNFHISVIEECDINILDDREIYYIALYDSTNKSIGYNTSIGGDAPAWLHNNIDIKDVIDLYCNTRLTLDAIAKKYDVSRYVITQILKSNHIDIRDRSDANTKYTMISATDIVVALNQCKSLRSAAKLLGVPYCTFRKACLANNIEYNSSKSARQSND